MRASTRLRLFLGGALLAFSAAAMAENAVTTDIARVRAGPDGSYPEVGELDANTPLQVMGCLDDWSWCDVVFGPNRGWIYSPEISFQYDGGYVPFYSYAPTLGVAVVPFSIDAYWGRYYHDRPWYRERDQWMQRPLHHQRPPGPLPSNSPPPHEVVRAGPPHAGSQPDESLRLSSAEPSRRDVVRPQRDEVSPRPAERMDTRRHEEERRAAPERPPVPSPKEEQGDHPR